VRRMERLDLTFARVEEAGALVGGP